MAKKILVTGGSGFIGSHTLETILSSGHGAVSIDTRAPEHFPKGAKDIRADICDFAILKEIFSKERPDAIVHLAAIPSVQTSVKDPVLTYEPNLRGTWNVLEAARTSGVGRVVFASSAAVYGYTAEERAGTVLSEDLPLRPKNPYGLAKKMGEELCDLWSHDVFWKGVDTVSLRFFNVYGPRQRRDAAYATCIERFLYQWQNKEPFTIVPPGTQRRDMVYVGDVVQAIVASAVSDKKFSGTAINVGSGKNYSVDEIADVIGGVSSPRVMISPRPADVREVLADVRKAKELLGWEPKVRFEEGIEMVKRYMEKK